MIGILWILSCGSCDSRSPPEGMVWIPGGEFTVGTDDPDGHVVEKPTWQARVNGFWMDATEVTNAQFEAFVEATGYVTVAERKPDWEELKKHVPPGTPKPADDLLVAASMVFTPPDRAVPLGDSRSWWSWVPGASWRHPEGPESNLDGKENHPVVQVCWDDAIAYAEWAGKRLPTEVEWEYAARGGLPGKKYVWGDEPLATESPRVNIWDGSFPHDNTLEDGHVRTAPVGSYAANGFGLFDMSGNVWEWCQDWYQADLYRHRAGQGVVDNPRGPDRPSDPSEPHALKRVTRGGSFLCSDSYCTAYRPSARRGTSHDTGMSHIGFRCVKDGDPK